MHMHSRILNSACRVSLSWREKADQSREDVEYADIVRRNAGNEGSLPLLDGLTENNGWTGHQPYTYLYRDAGLEGF